MALLDDVKIALRINNTAFDGEITDLIAAAKSDLILSGIIAAKANDDTDPLIKRALIVYCKANFGWNNPDAEKLQQSYDMLKMHLTLSIEYTCYAVTFVVTDGINPVDEATITFNSETKLTGAEGKVIFYIREGYNYEYKVSADGYETVEGNIDISANTTIPITLTAG